MCWTKIVRFACDSGALVKSRGFSASFFTGTGFFGSLVEFPFTEAGTAVVCFTVVLILMAAGGETGLARLVGVVFTLFVADVAGLNCDDGDTSGLLPDLDASRSALIFSALLSGLSARLSYVTLRRLVAGSLCSWAEGCADT
jgi:hypothetical protein